MINETHTRITVLSITKLSSQTDTATGHRPNHTPIELGDREEQAFEYLIMSHLYKRCERRVLKAFIQKSK